MAKKKDSKQQKMNYTLEYLKMVDERNPPSRVTADEFVENKTAIFGINEILQRHIIEINDGLKVSQKRIMLGLWGVNALHNKDKGVKSSQIVAKVISEYHPHGDESIYDSMVKMAQYWRYRYPLVIMKGNKGNKMGASHAAKRYTDAQMSKFAYDVYFKQWNPPRDFKNEGIADYLPSYSGFPEAQTLPTAFPLFLLLWGKNICTGRYSATAGFTIEDAARVIKLLLSDREADLRGIYPDDVRGCDIINKSELINYFDNEYSRVIVRATHEILEVNNRVIILIKGIPHGVSGISLVNQITKKYESGELDEIVDVTSSVDFDPNNTDCNIEITMRNGADINKALEKLYNLGLVHTTRISYGMVNSLRSVDYTPRLACLEWIRLRRETIRRTYQRDLTRIAARRNILRGFIRMIDEKLVEPIIKLIRKSTEAEARDTLIKKYKFTVMQADHIMKFRLKGFSTDNLLAYRDEFNELADKADKIMKVLHCPESIDDIIREDMDYFVKTYGDGVHRSRVYDLDDQMAEVVVSVEPVWLIMTDTNIKRRPVPEDFTYKLGTTSGKVKEVLHIRNCDSMLVADESGWITEFDISSFADVPGQSTGVSGMTDSPMVSWLYLDDTVKGDYDLLVSLTSDGNITLTELDGVLSTKSNKCKLMNVPKGARLAGVEYLSSESLGKVFAWTNKGNAILFNASEIPVTNRGTKGVGCGKLDDGEYFVGITVIPPTDDHIVIIDERGKIKRLLVNMLPSKDRMSKLYKYGNNIADVVSCNEDTQEMAVNTSQGLGVIKLYEIDPMTRVGKAKKVMELDKGEYVISFNSREV